MARGTLTIRMDDEELQELYSLQGRMSARERRHVSQRDVVMDSIRLMSEHLDNDGMH